MKIEEKGEFTYAVESESNSNVYTVCVPEKGIPSCDCKGFAFSQKCKHVDAVLKSLVPEKGKKSKPKDENSVQKEKNEEPENENPESEEKTEIEANGEKMIIPEKYIRYLPFGKEAVPFVLYPLLSAFIRFDGSLNRFHPEMTHFWMELSVVSGQQSVNTLSLMSFAESRKLIARLHKRQFMDEH